MKVETKETYIFEITEEEAGVLCLELENVIIQLNNAGLIKNGFFDNIVLFWKQLGDLTGKIDPEDWKRITGLEM